jgi:hypothetical protein
MEITEYVAEKAFGGVIKEGGFEIPGRAKFESVDPNRTRMEVLPARRCSNAAGWLGRAISDGW